MSDVVLRVFNIRATLESDQRTFRRGVEECRAAISASRRTIQRSRALLRETEVLASGATAQDVQAAGYHCYIFKDGNIASRHAIETASDAEAMIRACSYTTPSDERSWIEVWSGSRIVGRLTFS